MKEGFIRMVLSHYASEDILKIYMKNSHHVFDFTCFNKDDFIKIIEAITNF